MKFVFLLAAPASWAWSTLWLVAFIRMARFGCRAAAAAINVTEEFGNDALPRGALVTLHRYLWPYSGWRRARQAAIYAVAALCFLYYAFRVAVAAAFVVACPLYISYTAHGPTLFALASLAADRRSALLIAGAVVVVIVLFIARSTLIATYRETAPHRADDSLLPRWLGGFLSERDQRLIAAERHVQKCTSSALWMVPVGIATAVCTDCLEPTGNLISGFTAGLAIAELLVLAVVGFSTRRRLFELRATTTTIVMILDCLRPGPAKPMDDVSARLRAHACTAELCGVAGELDRFAAGRAALDEQLPEDIRLTLQRTIGLLGGHGSRGRANRIVGKLALFGLLTAAAFMLPGGTGLGLPTLGDLLNQ